MASPSNALEMTFGVKDGGRRRGNILAVLVIVPIKCFEFAKSRNCVLFQKFPRNRRKKHKKNLNVKRSKHQHSFIPLYLSILLMCIEYRECHNLTARFACVQSFVFI